MKHKLIDFCSNFCYSIVMENIPNKNALEPEKSPYNDPLLIAQSDGNTQHLDRLVGLQIAKQMLAVNPEDSGLQENLRSMQEALDSYINPQP